MTICDDRPHSGPGERTEESEKLSVCVCVFYEDTPLITNVCVCGVCVFYEDTLLITKKEKKLSIFLDEQSHILFVLLFILLRYKITTEVGPKY